MATMDVTGDPTALQIAGSDIDAGDYYLQNQGGEPIRIFEGDSAPGPIPRTARCFKARVSTAYPT